MMRRKIIGCPHTKYFMLHKVFYCAKLSNKQSAKVICTFDRLRTAHSNKQTSYINIGKLIICPHICLHSAPG